MLRLDRIELLPLLAAMGVAVAACGGDEPPARGGDGAGDRRATVSDADATGSVAAGRPQLQAYPEPTGAPPPTPTPEPDAAGRFRPPDGVPHRTEALSGSAHAAALEPLAADLAAGDAPALAARIGAPAALLTLDRYGESEGIGTRPTAREVEGMLAELFAAGAAPRLQGYFAPGCAQPSTCVLFVVTTGWRGRVAMPTKDPGEPIGPDGPEWLPTGAAAWALHPDTEVGPAWDAWWLGDGYHGLVEDLSDRALGTYVVLR